MNKLSQSSRTQSNSKYTFSMSPSVPIAFILSLALYGSAFLHFHTAILCSSHVNPLPFPSQKQDFKTAVTSLVPILAAIAYINIGHVLINALLILFGSSAQRRGPYILGILVNAIGILSCIAAITGVIVIGGKWNHLHSSSSTFYTLQTSVFIGDLSSFERNFRLQVLLGFLLFLPIDIYLVCFWVGRMGQRKKPALIFDQVAEEAKDAMIKLYQKQDCKVSTIQEDPKMLQKQSFEE